MSILTGIGHKFLEELPLGIHTLSEGTPDIIKVALYGQNATLSPLSTNEYQTAHEVSGGGYTAGGVTVAMTVVGATGSARADGMQFAESGYIQPTLDTVIAVSGVSVRGCMLYNSSQSDRNIFTLDFGETFTPVYGVTITWGLAGVDQYMKTLIPLIGSVS